jgi:cell division transport system permease protein
LANERIYRKYSNTLPVIISIALVLYVLGGFGLFFWSAYNVSKDVQRNLKFEVFFNDNATDQEIRDLQSDLKLNLVLVREIRYISKDEAARTFIGEYGEDFTEVLGYNPLKASIEVFINNEQAGREEMEELIAKVEKSAGVYEVKYSQPVLQNVGSQLRDLSVIFLVLVVLLLIISLALINNSIHLSFFAQRFLIKSMQLVGATKGFILKPYLWNAVLQGFLGALISITLISASLFFITKSFPVTKDMVHPLHLSIIYCALVGVGVVITLGSSLIVLRKYLGKSAYRLY